MYATAQALVLGLSASRTATGNRTPKGGTGDRRDVREPSPPPDLSLVPRDGRRPLPQLRGRGGARARFCARNQGSCTTERPSPRPPPRSFLAERGRQADRARTPPPLPYGDGNRGCRQVVYGRGGRGVRAPCGPGRPVRCRSPLSARKFARGGAGGGALREGCAPAGPRTRSGGATAVSLTRRGGGSAPLATVVSLPTARAARPGAQRRDTPKPPFHLPVRVTPITPAEVHGLDMNPAQTKIVAPTLPRSANDGCT